MDFTIRVELTASPALLEAIKGLTQTFQGQSVAPALVAPEKPRTGRTKTEPVTAPEPEKVVEPVIVPEPEKVVEPEPVVPPEPVAVPEGRIITIEELRMIVRDKAQAGKREAIKEVLTLLDATSVTTLKEEQYAEFLTKVETL